MAEVEPAGGAGPGGERPVGDGSPANWPQYRPVKWAVDWTGLGRRTVHRRLDAWRSPNEWERLSPYAIRGTKRPNVRGDRMVDPVDAERVRLQENGRLPENVNTQMWLDMIVRRDVPWLYVTDEAWFRSVVPAAREG